MKLPELHKVKVLKKYKMFFIDAVNESTGEIITAYTKNKGGFAKEMAPGKTVLVSKAKDPSRKTQYSVELIEQDGVLTGVDPNIGAKLLSEYLASQKEIKILKKEVSLKDSRLDLQLQVGDKVGFGEIKSVFTFQEKSARFPEAPTPRGQKHLKALIELAQQKTPAYLFYIVQVPHAEQLNICTDIDPEYGQLMKQAKKHGVKIIALKCHISETEIKIVKEIPVVF